jgi:hypothetical protein
MVEAGVDFDEVSVGEPARRQEHRVERLPVQSRIISDPKT